MCAGDEHTDSEGAVLRAAKTGELVGNLKDAPRARSAFPAVMCLGSTRTSLSSVATSDSIKGLPRMVRSICSRRTSLDGWTSAVPTLQTLTGWSSIWKGCVSQRVLLMPKGRPDGALDLVNAQMTPSRRPLHVREPELRACGAGVPSRTRGSACVDPPCAYRRRTNTHRNRPAPLAPFQHRRYSGIVAKSLAKP